MSARRRIIPVFVPHMGCAHDCVFCNQRRISGSHSSPGLSELRNAVLSGLEKNPNNEKIQLAFYGGSFTAIPLKEQQALLEGALPFLCDGSIDSLRVSTRPDAVDRETLERLRAFGVATIELGAQSMDGEVLSLSGRGHTAGDTESSARLVKEMGFELILQMMTGLPGDTREKTLLSGKKLIALSPDGVRIYPAVVIEGTRLFDMWRAGEYEPHSVETAAEWCAELLPMFEEAGIPVIRLGLNPSEELSCGVAAGAYHPAFGEIVRSRILMKRAEKLLDGNKTEKSVVLGVNRSDISPMIGQGRGNLRALAEKYALDDIEVREAPVNRGELVLLRISAL